MHRIGQNGHLSKWQNISPEDAPETAPTRWWTMRRSARVLRTFHTSVAVLLIWKRTSTCCARCITKCRASSTPTLRTILCKQSTMQSNKAIYPRKPWTATKVNSQHALFCHKEYAQKYLARIYLVSPMLCVATGIEALIDELMHTEQLNKKVCCVRFSHTSPVSTFIFT